MRHIISSNIQTDKAAVLREASPKPRRAFGIFLSGTSSTALRLAQWCWLLHMLLDQFLGDSSILPSPSVLTLLVLVLTSAE